MRRKIVTALLIVVLCGLASLITWLATSHRGRNVAVQAPQVKREPIPQHGWVIGSVRASDGTPLAGSNVTLSNESGSRSVVADAAGMFRLEIAPGTYDATVTTEGSMPERRRVTVVAGSAAMLSIDTAFGSDQAAAHAEEIATLERQLMHSRRETAAAERRASRAPAGVSQPDLPAPPPPVVESRVEPSGKVVFAEAPVSREEQNCTPGEACAVRVFYATDRNTVPAARRSKRYRSYQVYYGPNRSKSNEGEVSYGWCDVTIPPNHQKMTGKLDMDTYDVKTSVFVHDIVKKERKEFITTLKERVDLDPRKELFVFVHGYNVTFFEAARRTAQMHYDLGFHGAPVFFSWPSGGSMFDYWADEASSEWSSRHLREFLDLLAEQSGAERIHLIGHSMGSRPLTRALAEIGARVDSGCPVPAHRAKFSQLILAAPDLDRDMFVQLKDALARTSDRVTLYASRRDRAVLLSWILHRFSRLGVPSGDPNFGDRIDAIDASRASTGFLGHSYYGTSVLWDVRLMFDDPDLPVDERCTVAAATPPNHYRRFIPQTDEKPPGWLRRTYRRLAGKRKEETIDGKCHVAPVAIRQPRGARRTAHIVTWSLTHDDAPCRAVLLRSAG